MTPRNLEFVIGYSEGGEQRTLRLSPAVAALAVLTAVSVAFTDGKQAPLEVIQASAGPVPDPPVAPGIAPGSPDGAPPDIITPLNVRDPAALVLAPPGMYEPPAAAPAAPPEPAKLGTLPDPEYLPEPEPLCLDPYGTLKALPLRP